MSRARTLGLTAIVAIAALAVGIGIGRRAPMPVPAGTTGLEHAAHEENAPRQLWTCGMHPQVLQDHPGPCPICGMQLTPVEIGDHIADLVDGAEDGVVHGVSVARARAE